MWPWLTSMLWVAFVAIAACDDPNEPARTAVTPPVVSSQVASAAEEPERAPTCTYHGWCWVYPLPQGNGLHGVWAVRPGLSYAVGERGTIVRFEGGESAIEDSPTRELLHDVWGTDEAHIIAVGEAGTILSRGSEGWVEAPAQTPRAIRAVWGASANDVYAVGEGGTILRWDGTTWTTESASTELDFRDVWGTDDGAKVFALAVDLQRQGSVRSGAAPSGREAVQRRGAAEDGAGIADPEYRGVVFTRENGAWTETRAIEEDVATLFVDAAGDPYLVGAGGWPKNDRRAELRITRPVNAVWAASSTDVFAVAYDGQITRMSGDDWAEMESPAAAGDLLAVSGTSSTDVWAVGASGLVLHFDGVAWARRGAGLEAHLEAIWGFGDRDIWAVGDHTTLHWDGATWSVAGPTDHDLRALWGSGSTLLAAGAEGALYRYEAGEWRAEHQGGDFALDAIFGTGADHVFAVGESTWLEQEDGGFVARQDRPTAAGVWGSGPDDIWVVGADGIHHSDGTTWTAVPSTAGVALFGVWGAAADDVWACGAEGRLLHYDGSQWREEGAPSSQSLLAIWGRSESDIFVVGDHGTILHFDGTEWRWRDSGTDNVLHSVWGTSEGVWAVGHGGTILRLGR